MTASGKASYTVGFQESETSSVEVTVYPHGDDPILDTQRAPWTFTGVDEESDAPSVVGLDMQMQLGSSSGVFNVQVKAGPNAYSTLEDTLVFAADDWIDITLKRHGESHHKLRGIIENVVRMETIAEGGSTDIMWTVSGRSFGAVFDKTPIYYDRVAGEVGEWDVINVFGSVQAVARPDEIVEKVLIDFLGGQNDRGRSFWQIPAGMPLAPVGSPTVPGQPVRFAQALAIDTTNFDNEPDRVCNPQILTADNASLWSLAQEYSDPMFTELIAELEPTQKPSRPGDRQMRVTFRTKPFPTVASSAAWSALPITILGRTELKHLETTISDHDRFNAFFLSPAIWQEAGQFQDLVGALWFPDDIQRHGIRKFEVQSRYTAVDQNAVKVMAETQRKQVRDWHCMNQYFQTGTIAAGRFVPEADVGQRLRIQGAQVEDYYIEGIRHQWSLPLGGRTTFTVTRGWAGGDPLRNKALNDIANRYETVNETVRRRSSRNNAKLEYGLA